MIFLPALIVLYAHSSTSLVEPKIVEFGRVLNGPAGLGGLSGLSEFHLPKGQQSDEPGDLSDGREAEETHGIAQIDVKLTFSKARDLMLFPKMCLLTIFE